MSLAGQPLAAHAAVCGWHADMLTAGNRSWRPNSALGAGETLVAKELGGRSRDSYQLAQDARAAANAAALNACNHSISNRFKVVPAAPVAALHACSAPWLPVVHSGPCMAAVPSGRGPGRLIKDTCSILGDSSCDMATEAAEAFAMIHYALMQSSLVHTSILTVRQPTHAMCQTRHQRGCWGAASPCRLPADTRPR